MDLGKEALENLRNCVEDVTTCRKKLISAEASFKHSLLIMQANEEKISTICFEELTTEMDKMWTGLEGLKGLATGLSSLYFHETKVTNVLSRSPKGRNADSGIASEDSRVLYGRSSDNHLDFKFSRSSEETSAKKLNIPPNNLSQISTEDSNTKSYQPKVTWLKHCDSLPEESSRTEDEVQAISKIRNSEFFTEQLERSEQSLLNIQGQAVRRPSRQSSRDKTRLTLDSH